MSLSDFQPPSPSLSPTSQIKIYHEQLDRAHSLIDQLEIVLAEKQSRKENVNSTNVPKLKMHSKNQSLLIDTTQTNQIPIRSYVTPRESNLSQRMSADIYTNLSPIHYPTYISDLQQRHSELVNQSREEQSLKNSKIKEIQDQYNDLKEELLHCKEQHRLSDLEKTQTSSNLEQLNNERVIISEKLKQSKVYGQQLEGILLTLDLEKETHEHKYFVSTNKTLKRKRNEIKTKKPDSELKDEVKQLKQEIINLKQSKTQHEAYYADKIKDLESKLSQQSIKVEELNANLSPNQRDVRIYKGADILMQLKLSEKRFKTESEEKLDSQFKQQRDEEISVQSFAKVGKHKNRSCDACNIF